MAAKYGSTKDDIVQETIKAPDVIEDYKKGQRAKSYNALDHEQIAEAEGASMPDWQGLLNAVHSIAPGAAGADAYEKAVEGLLTALLYPDAANPILQSPIHDGRKRVDIQYDNMAAAGFFNWLSKHYPSALIFVECKNYAGSTPASGKKGTSVKNPELDQLSSRFSRGRGQFGLLVARTFDDKQRFIESCRDTARDDRGYIIPLDDGDLAELVRSRASEPEYRSWPLIRGVFQRLIT